MRSKAERSKQLKNTILASAASLIPAGVAALVSLFWLNLSPVITILISAAVFAAVLAVLIFLWKKTDFIRNILYSIYCIKHPASTRNYYCPCCSRTLVGFSDMRYSKDHERYDPARFKTQRQDVICPFCYSAPRQRILASWADENRTDLKSKKMLYFAPEYSMMKWFKRNKITPVTADLFAPNVDLKLDLTKIDLPDGSYDMVIVNHVLEHVDSYEKALSELNRILVTGGKLIISFPIDQSLDTVREETAETAEERIRYYGQYDHVRLFGKDSGEIISSFGFEVSIIDTSKMQESILPVTGPADYDSNIIYYCKKI